MIAVVLASCFFQQPQLKPVYEFAVYLSSFRETSEGHLNISFALLGKAWLLEMSTSFHIPSIILGVVGTSVVICVVVSGQRFFKSGSLRIMDSLQSST